MIDVLTVVGAALCPPAIAVIACYFYDFTHDGGHHD